MGLGRPAASQHQTVGWPKASDVKERGAQNPTHQLQTRKVKSLIHIENRHDHTFISVSN